MSDKITIYLRTNYETCIPGDFSNGTFYSGMISLPKEDVKKFKEDFLNRKKFKMYPHKAKTLWSEPIFENCLKEFDFSGECYHKMPDRETIRLAEPNNYKYYYWLEEILTMI